MTRDARAVSRARKSRASISALHALTAALATTRAMRAHKRNGCNLDSCGSGTCIDAATTSEEGIARTRVQVGARTQPSVFCGDGLVAPKNVYVFYCSNADSRAKYRRSRLNTSLPLLPPPPSAYVTGTPRDKPSSENQLMNLQVVHSHWQLTFTTRDPFVRRPRSIYSNVKSNRSHRVNVVIYTHTRLDSTRESTRPHVDRQRVYDVCARLVFVDRRLRAVERKKCCARRERRVYASRTRSGPSNLSRRSRTHPKSTSESFAMCCFATIPLSLLKQHIPLKTKSFFTPILARAGESLA